MANELTVSVDVRYAKGGDSLNFSTAKQITVSGTKRISNVQALSTTAEVVAVGEVGTAGVAWFKNLDATNNILLGLDSDADPSFAVIKPGEAFVIRLASSTLYAKSSAGTPSLAYGVIED
jgi:hypothetical protein